MGLNGHNGKNGHNWTAAEIAKLLSISERVILSHYAAGCEARDPEGVAQWRRQHIRPRFNSGPRATAADEIDAPTKCDTSDRDPFAASMDLAIAFFFEYAEALDVAVAIAKATDGTKLAKARRAWITAEAKIHLRQIFCRLPRYWQLLNADSPIENRARAESLFAGWLGKLPRRRRGG